MAWARPPARVPAVPAWPWRASRAREEEGGLRPVGRARGGGMCVGGRVGARCSAVLRVRARRQQPWREGRRGDRGGAEGQPHRAHAESLWCAVHRHGRVQRARAAVKGRGAGDVREGAGAGGVAAGRTRDQRGARWRLACARSGARIRAVAAWPCCASGARAWGLRRARAEARGRWRGLCRRAAGRPRGALSRACRQRARREGRRGDRGGAEGQPHRAHAESLKCAGHRARPRAAGAGCSEGAGRG